MSTPRTVRLSPNDNVVVAVDPVPEGTPAAGVTWMSRWLKVYAAFAALAVSWTANVCPPADFRVTVKGCVPASAAVKVYAAGSAASVSLLLNATVPV